MASIEQEINSKIVDDKQKFVVNLVYTSGLIKNMFTDFIKPYDISSQQFNILRILRGDGDWLSMNIVKERMIEKSPNATRLADKLISKKLIERQRSDADRRVVFVKITKLGLELLTKIDTKDNVKFEELISKISPEEAKLVSDILDKMRG